MLHLESPPLHTYGCCHMHALTAGRKDPEPRRRICSDCSPNFGAPTYRLRVAAPNRVSPPLPLLRGSARPSQNRPIRRAWRGSRHSPCPCLVSAGKYPLRACSAGRLPGRPAKPHFFEPIRIQLGKIGRESDWHPHSPISHLLCLQPALELVPAISVRYFDDQLITMLPRHCVLSR